ncbi:MAG: cupin domain-containing protein [Actinobacteria bacterium]|nr:cupin domain-containing protein [Actinomycetota bacterium]
MAKIADTLQVDYDEFCGALAAKDLQPLWKINKQIMPQQPHPKTLPWLWNWSTLLPLAQRAGELITIDRGGDRRVLALCNPGLNGMPYTSTTLWGAVQYLAPGESAPAHRHTPGAIRFVMEGEGVWTTVNGDACDMTPGDLVLTPNWHWHDHTNAGDQPMVWFDGLDLPLVGWMESVFFELYPDNLQPIDARNGSERLYGRGTVPTDREEQSLHSPLLRYPYSEVSLQLDAMLEETGLEVTTLNYVNPINGHSALPTLGLEMTRIREGASTRPYRKAGSSIVVVFRGAGHSVIDGQRFDWSEHDIFVIPSWATVEHVASESSDLFVTTDRPVLQVLGLFREEYLEHPQKVTGTFEPR